ncbi:hypothetical protein [Frankia sp. AgB32]|uniref:hypothetical protein n=1 Tax=Frankia sp. AgB32 TaxID=631119 RepID=UPI00200CF125|nr:hypothetical protein [Frankia sp. AgB32]MCK9893216.1 hypothetical protein [Frankia sp. AgB32]
MSFAASPGRPGGRGPSAVSPPNSADRPPQPARRLRRMRSSFVAASVMVAVSGLVAVGGAGTAEAGGASWASCPSNQISYVSVPPEPGQPSGGMTYLQGGYYAHVAQSWPPSTDLLCRTGPGRGPAAGEPSFRVEHMGCPDGVATFGVPRPTGGNGFGGPPVKWGSFLPQGWYDLSDPAVDPGWTAVCWSPTNRTKRAPGPAPTPAVSPPPAAAPTGSTPVAPVPAPVPAPVAAVPANTGH